MKCLAFLPCAFNELTNFDELNILKNGRKIGKCHQGSKLIIFRSLLDYFEFLSNDLNKNQLYLIGDHFNKKSQELARPLNKLCQEKFHNLSQKIEISLNKRINHISSGVLRRKEEPVNNEWSTVFKRNVNVDFIVYSVLISCVISIGLIVLAYFNVKLNRFLFFHRNNNI